MPVSYTKIYEHDRTWAWKFALRTIAIVFDIAGIGFTAWAIANLTNTSNIYPNNNDFLYFYDFGYAQIPWNLISLSFSLIWSLANISVLLARSRWIHPGANVGCDLIIWLSFIATALLSTGAAAGELGDYHDSGDYYSSTYGTYPNGTAYLITPDHPAQPCPGFDSCAQRDEFVHRIHVRGIVVAVASALAWILVLVHFALFVSACRYTHDMRRERENVSEDKLRDAEKVIEERVIQKLEAEGRLMPATRRQEGVGQEPGPLPPQTTIAGLSEGISHCQSMGEETSGEGGQGSWRDAGIQ